VSELLPTCNRVRAHQPTAPPFLPLLSSPSPDLAMAMMGWYRPLAVIIREKRWTPPPDIHIMNARKPMLLAWPVARAMMAACLAARVGAAAAVEAEAPGRAERDAEEDDGPAAAACVKKEEGEGEGGGVGSASRRQQQRAEQSALLKKCLLPHPCASPPVPRPDRSRAGRARSSGRSPGLRR
jgi:hypothetical protein